MSFLNPSDMVEEDAADLQFPKVANIHSDNVVTILPDSNTKFCTNTFDIKSFESHVLQSNCCKNNSCIKDLCSVCQKQLQLPYIKCAECPSFLCVKCFAKGKETLIHNNSHNYIVVHESLELFPNSNWTIADERKLLECLETWGYGNWEDIASAMANKFSKEECAQHYHKYYFDGIFEKRLGLTNQYYFPERIPYFYKMVSVDPPRCETVDSFHFNNMDGYRCARSDFDIPYDKSAETLINEINTNDINISDNKDDDDENYEMKIISKAEENLKIGVVQAYNNRIKERKRRYRIMQEHGLLVPNKTQSWLSKYNEAIKMHFNPLSNKFESLQYYIELKKYLYNLFEFRSNGIKTLYGAKIYNRLKAKRIKYAQELKSMESFYDWRIMAPTEDGGDISQLGGAIISLNGKSRKKAGPINIMGFPGYDKLTDNERKICSSVRILPASYLEFKKILQNECSKIGFLRLSDARRLIKIDVNKTRQLYDFLIENGYCNKPIDG
ncbi:transcriptional adapter 2A isoform X2 [Condylostylus longicornis]|uniref:transcriptional adapter 2A isoform X2 n=1 Tax=Condylostylus longicornis TaxID=2530218 RepID=UPI00244E5711|nr:transcriptional adapter 2A isoform X2 [Condylostylus longicornis]